MRKLLFLLAFCLPLWSTENIEADNQRLLVHLLNYIASDYSGAVDKKNQVLNSFEYQEQQEFVERISELSANLKIKGQENYRSQVKNLKSLIDQKANPDEVGQLASKLSQELISLTGISTVPSQAVDFHQGKILYEQNCSQCQGVTGEGNGPSSKNFNPPPTNFGDSKLQSKGPFQFYNIIKLGVPGTAMAAFDYLSSSEIWNLAFYVNQLKTGKTDTELEGTPSIFLMQSHVALEQSLAAYSRKDYASARNFAVSAYLDGIEPLEPKLRLKNSEFSSQLEAKLMRIRQSIVEKVPLTEYRNLIQSTLQQVEEASILVAHQKPSLWFIYSVSFGIFLREAFEAALLLITLLGVVKTFGNRKAILAVHGGWSSALLLGIMAWFFSGWVMKMTGAQREVLEGSVSLFAVLVLLFFGLWMHRKTEIGRWRNFIKDMVNLAKQRTNVLILGIVAFMGVFREVFETVVFLRALLLESGGEHQIALGLGVATAFLIVLVLSWLSVKWSSRLPVRQLFMVSSWVMFFLSFILLGKGIHALQETGLIPVTELGFQLRSDLIGLYPFYQTLGPQMVLILSLMLLHWWDSKHHSGSTKKLTN